MIISLALLPLKAADEFIMGDPHSIAVRLSKMHNQKSLTIR